MSLYSLNKKVINVVLKERYRVMPSELFSAKNEGAEASLLLVGYESA